MGTTVVLHAPPPERAPRAWLEDWTARVHAAAREVTQDGSLWLVSSNAWVRGELVPAPYLLADAAPAVGLRWRNVYARHHAPRGLGGKAHPLAHEVIAHLVRSPRDARFDKAPLREPHVYESLEWGGRSVGRSGYHSADRVSRRYPPGGRDPGNVLYEARRDAEGRVLALEEVPRAGVLARLVEATTAPGWAVLANVDAKPLAAALPDRRVEERTW